MFCYSLFKADEEQPTVLNPRGPRLMEHGFKADKCATEKEWPICMDEDWVQIMIIHCISFLKNILIKCHINAFSTQTCT